MWRIVLLGALLAPATLLAQQRNLAVAPVQLAIPGERPVKLYDNSFALVIGASAYANWPRLPGVPGDVRAVTAALREQGFKVTEVLNPTLAQLDAAARRFISEYGQNQGNRVLIYFAGHGYTLKSAAGGQLGYIVPVDAPLPERGLGAFKASAMSMETIENYAKQIDAKHALFVFDSCFSGTFFKMRAAPESITLKTANPVRQFITAGGADQAVPDVSVFRQQFVAGIKGEADLNGDGYVTGSELGMFLEDKVTNYSRQTQTPQYGKIRDPSLDKGDFVFALRKREAPVRTAGVDPLAVELEFWNSVKDSHSADELHAYLDQYPQGQFAPIARARLRSVDTPQPVAATPPPPAAPTQLASLSPSPTPGSGPVRSLEVVDLNRGNTAAQIQACVPQRSGNAEAAEKLFSDDTNYTTAYGHAQATSYFVARSRGTQKKGVCMHLSPQGWAVIPTDVLEKALKIDGVDSSQSRSWYDTLQADLARSGKAVGAVVYYNGNANEVSLSLNPGGQADTVIFNTRFMKSGEYNPASYPNSVGGAKGFGVTSQNRGNTRLLSLFKD